MGNLVETYAPLLEAVSFAARAHEGQKRKDRRTPYVSHVFRVCLILRHVFGVADSRALIAAVLHDTIEDTTTDFDDLTDLSGGKAVAEWVAALSKDKRRQEEDRETAYKDTLARAPWQVQLCKLADVFDNLLDSSGLNDSQFERTLARSRSYLDALRQPNIPPGEEVQAASVHGRAHATVCELLREIEMKRRQKSGQTA